MAGERLVECSTFSLAGMRKRYVSRRENNSVRSIDLRNDGASFQLLQFVGQLISALFNFNSPAKRSLLTIFLVLSIDQAFAEDLYPAVYYRGKEYQGVHCISTNPLKKTREIYMLKIASWDELNSLTPHRVRVAEFFSGRRYRAKIQKTDGYREIKLATHYSNIVVDCGANEKSISTAPDKSMRIDEKGDYLNFERIDESGQWGDVHVYMCDGRGGRVYCDVGVSGLSRRSKDGTVRWARMITVGKKNKYGHPIYKLPDALEIEDRFNEGTLLEDGTAVLTFSNGPSVRIDLVKGTLLEYRPNVAMVSLDSWAELKHIMHERWLGKDNPCLNLIKSNPRCQKGLVKMYFYSLQQYLFPANKINWN